MESYCVKCKKNTKNIDPRYSGTSNSKAVIFQYVVVKKSRFIKNDEAKGQ